MGLVNFSYRDFFEFGPEGFYVFPVQPTLSLQLRSVPPLPHFFLQPPRRLFSMMLLGISSASFPTPPNPVFFFESIGLRPPFPGLLQIRNLSNGAPRPFPFLGVFSRCFFFLAVHPQLTQGLSLGRSYPTSFSSFFSQNSYDSLRPPPHTATVSAPSSV